MNCPDAGDSCCFSFETPQHEVHVPEFSIDRLEATIGEYRECVTAGACDAPPSNMLPCTYSATPGEREDHPVNCLGYEMAEAYCDYRGKRVCTESEWEKAARGGCEQHTSDCAAESNARHYPWGSSLSYVGRIEEMCENMNFWPPRSTGVGAGCDSGGTWPVGSRPSGASLYGVHNMAGNAWEFVQDTFSPALNYTDTPTDGAAYVGAGPRLARGGSFQSSGFQTRTAHRASSVLPDSFNTTCCGIRCCSDAAN